MCRVEARANCILISLSGLSLLAAHLISISEIRLSFSHFVLGITIMVRHVTLWLCPTRSRCLAKQDMTGPRAPTRKLFRTGPGHIVGPVMSVIYAALDDTNSLDGLFGGTTSQENQITFSPLFTFNMQGKNRMLF